MAFLEYGVEKYVLTPNMMKYVDMSISKESKAEHMEEISAYYINTLREFFNVNSGDKEDYSRPSESDKQEYQFNDMMKDRLKNV